MLLAVYLSECIFFSSGRASLFKRPIRGNGSASSPLCLVISTYKVVIEGFLPRIGSVFVAEPAPPLISPSGVCCSPYRTDGFARYIDFSDAESFLVKDCSVWSGSKFVCCSGTSQQAQRLSNLLDEVRASDITEREALITASFHKMLNTGGAARRWKAYQRASALLSFGSWTLLGAFVSLFALLVFFRFQLIAVLPLAVFALVFIPHTAYLFYRVHLMFFRQNVHERWKQIVLMFLMPPACIRASDFIAHELFAGFHSLAVSRVLSDDNESRNFTGRTLREMMYPTDSDNESSSSEAAVWAKRKWMAVVWEWAEQEFGDPRQLLGVPKKTSESCICYCPRCLTQYLLSRSYCADCPGVAVVPF